jgi:PAS domain S-box-containing protein
MPKLPGIGKRIAQRLLELGFSKAGRVDVARFCAERGYRPQYLYAWLAGRTPTFENLERLATDLSVSRSWLVMGEESVGAVAREVGLDVRRSPRPPVQPAPDRARRAGHEAARPRPAPTLQLLDFARLREVTGKLIQLEAQLAAIFEAFPDLYVWVDGLGTILDWKGGRTAVPDVLLGASIGRRVDEVFADGTGPRLRQAITAAVESGTPGMVDYTAHVEGVEHTFEARLMPLDSPGTLHPHLLVVVRDITERVRAERAVRESEAHYRALVEGSIEGICILQGGVVRFANQALCEIFGYPSPDAFIGRPAGIFLTPEERQRPAGYDEARIRGEAVPARYEVRGLRADRTPIWLENVSTMVTWDGQPAVLVTTQDITRRKRAQEAAAALAEVARQMAAMLDLNQVVQHMLDSVMRLLRLQRAALYLLDPLTGDLRCLAASGEARPEELVGRVLPAGNGVLGRAVALGRPVTSTDVLIEPDTPLPEWLRELNGLNGLTAVIGVPLIAREKVFGGLVVGDTRGRVYTEEEQSLLVAFAMHAAVALDNARRYHELEERLRTREAGQG